MYVQVSKIYVLFVIITTTQQFILGFLQFLLCFTFAQANQTEVFVMGRRVEPERRALTFVYLWVREFNPTPEKNQCNFNNKSNDTWSEIADG